MENLNFNFFCIVEKGFWFLYVLLVRSQVWIPFFLLCDYFSSGLFAAYF